MLPSNPVLLARPRPVPVVAGSLDAATTAWINAVVAAGGSVSAGRQTIVDNLITGLKSDGVWTKLDRLWLLAAENTQSALTDLVADSAATISGTVTFTANHDYTGNGSTGFINTNVNPSTAGGNFALNSGSIFTYGLTNGNNLPAFSSQPTFNGTSATWLYPQNGTTSANVNGATSITASTANSAGMFVASRTGATTIVLYQNGSSIVSGATASVSIPNENLAFMHGDFSDFSTQQIAAGGFGAGLSATEAGNLTTRINTYMTSLVINVF